MNLIAQQNRNIYTSNILGNNLAVALGVAQTSKIKSTEFVTWVVTGDGALEEGIFFETLLSASSWSLPIVVIVENNQWSLGTKVTERRKEISLSELCNSLHVEYLQLEGNDVVTYFEMLKAARKTAATGIPVLVEVHLETLGGYYVDEPRGKRYINYHAGKALINSEKIIAENLSDPIYVNTLTSAEQAQS
jgi:TPP-dependent pyruvate/acetoin dehydrogenase alpha subunit